MKTSFSFLVTPLFLFWLATILTISVVLCLWPMTRTLGYEYSFILGVVISLAAGHLATVYPGRIRQQKAPFPGANTATMKLFFRGLLPSFVLLTVSLIIILANGLFTPPCNNQVGLYFFLMLPVVSAIVATTVGLTLGLFFRNARWATIAWFFCWVLSLAYVGYLIYSTPAVYAYGPFLGYWPGVLYDKGISIDQGFLTYRAYNLFGVISLLLGIGVFLNLNKMQLSLKGNSIKKNGWAFVIFLSFTILMGLFADSLRHQTTTATLERALPFVARAGSLELFFDKDISPQKRHELFGDAQFSLFQIMRFGEIEKAPPIKIFVFKNATQKKKWMGAHHTSVAKPWLGQTYIVEDQIPHLTLRHELAHLLFAKFGEGPFQIAGKLGGWIPTPGLIEGIATAATPVTGEMSLHQLAKGMKDLNLLPSLQTLLGIKFLGLFSKNAYTASGSFCLFLKTEYGATVLKQLFGGKSAEQLTGLSLSKLEKQWLKHLEGIEVSTQQRHEISYRFDRPAIVSTRCVREVTRLEKQIAAASRRQDWRAAVHLANEAHQVSGESSQTEMMLLTTMANCRKTDSAALFGKTLLKKETDVVRSNQIEELLLDLQKETMSSQTLSKNYYALFQASVTTADARRLYIKSHFANMTQCQSRLALKHLSIAQRTTAPNVSVFLYDLMQLLQQHPTDSLAMYLAAQLLYQQGAPFRAAQMMKRAIRSNLLDHPLAYTVQAHLTLAQSYMKLHQYALAQKHFLKVKKIAKKELGIAAIANDWLQKIEWLNSQG